MSSQQRSTQHSISHSRQQATQAGARRAAFNCSRFAFTFAFSCGLPLALLSAPLAHAATEAPQDAATVVVSAARMSQSVEDALPSTTVLTRADLARSQDEDLVAVLGRQAGLQLLRSGGQGSQASLFSRGTSGSELLVLIDGVPLNSAVDSTAFLASLPLDNVERIEIVRGNLSALYGAGAVGGVVQVFTRDPSTTQAEGLVEAGQGNTRAAHANASIALGGGVLSAGLGRRSQDAVSAQNPAQYPVNPARDGNRGENRSLRWHWRATHADFSAWAWDNHSDTSYDDGSNFSATVPATQARQTEYRVQRGQGLGGHVDLGDWTLSARLAQVEDNADTVSTISNADAQAAFNFGDNFGTRSRNREASLQALWHAAHGLDFTAGTDLQRQAAGGSLFDPNFSNASLPVFRRHVDAWWLGHTGSLGEQQWQLNLRHDRTSDFGGATTGLAAWGWRFAPGWRLGAQASSAFDAPTFVQLDYPGGYGNPALRPQHAHAGELSLRWAQGPWSAGLTEYRNRVSDLIQTPPSGLFPVNLAQAQFAGREWQVGWADAGWHVQAGLDQVQARQIAPVQGNLLRRAHVSMHASADCDQGPWTFSLAWLRVGERPDASYDPVFPYTTTPLTLAASQTTRVALGYRISPALRLRLRVENVFDAHTESVYGYSSLPRQVIAGLEARL